MFPPLRNAIGRVSRACLSTTFSKLKLTPSRSIVITSCQPLKQAPRSLQQQQMSFTTGKLEVMEDDQSIDHELTAGSETLTKKVVEKDLKVIISDYIALQEAGPMAAAQYHAVLENLAIVHSFDEAVKVFNDMKAAGLADAKAYTQVIMSVRPSLLFHELRFLFGEPMEGRDEEASYDTRTSEHFLEVCALLEEMKAAGLKLEMFFYENLMTSLAAGRQAGIMINICMTLEKAGIIPSTAFYNQLLLTLPRRGFMQRATALFERMVARGQANYQTHLIRLNWLAASGRIDEALEFFQEISQKFTVNAVAYNILISGYLRLGKRNEAFDLFDEMVKMKDCQPDRVTCSALLSYLYNSSDMSRAKTVFDNLNKAGYPKTGRDYGLLVRVFARLNPAEADRLLEEVIAKDSFDAVMCNEMVRVVIDRKVINEWKGVFMDKIVAHFKLTSDEMTAFLPQLLIDRQISSTGHQFRNSVRELLAIMESKKWSPTTYTLEYIVRRMIMQKDVSKLEEYARYLKDNQVIMTWNIRNLLIQANLIKGNTDEVDAILKTMIRNKTPLNNTTIDALNEHGVTIPATIRRMGQDADSGETTPRSMVRQPQIHVTDHYNSRVPIGI